MLTSGHFSWFVCLSRVSGLLGANQTRRRRRRRRKRRPARKTKKLLVVSSVRPHKVIYFTKKERLIKILSGILVTYYIYHVLSRI